MALKQRRPETEFELGNALADQWLRPATNSRRLTETAQLGDIQQQLQIVQIHRHK